MPRTSNCSKPSWQISKQLGARGDLVIEFSVIFPATLNEQQRNIIVAAL
jgi:DnaJ-class molecular chaperone